MDHHFKYFNPEDFQKGRFRPASEKIIMELEEEIGKVLPIAYLEFLLLTGFNFPPTRFNMAIDKLQLYDEVFKAQLSDYRLEIKREHFVIGMREGETFALFFWDEGDNPPVYLSAPSYCEDGWPLLTLRNDTFSEFILQELKRNSK
ncbi:MAG: SMI1/KNR4 family protein [Bacteroidia bacterium]|nr:SMI1/KNR4 family protein [Bacteroidia bacterium]